MNNKVTIFLASSSELSCERDFIGNRVRMLGDEWETRGVRVILNIWEDYDPDYTGGRKQTQYDQDLVDASNIVFGLFRKVCGKYSQEEVQRAYSNNQDNLHCYRLPSEDNDAVLAFEASSGIVMELVENREEVWQKIKEITEEYITVHSLEKSEPQVIEKEKIYLTLGKDLREDEDTIGNIIRGVDVLADREIGIRCQLLPLHVSPEIGISDYYIAMLNNMVDAQDEIEFVTAYKGLFSHKHPSEMVVFQKEGGIATRYKARNEVSSLMNKKGKEFFPVVYNNLDTVKLTLILHLIKKKRILSTSAAFSLGLDNILFFGNQRIADAGKVLGLITGQVNSFTVDVSLQELMMPSFPKLDVEGRLRDKIRDLLYAGNLVEEEAAELVNKCSDLIALLKKNTGRFYQPDYVLRVMLMRIACNDRYDEFLGNTPDEFYKEFVDYADRYSVEDILVEEMRINYAKGLARAGHENEALRIYGVVRRNMSRIGESSKFMHYRYIQLYYNALAVLSTIGQRYELEQWSEELKTLVELWIQADASLEYYRCYFLAFRIDVLPVDELADESFLDEAEKCWRQTKKMAIRNAIRFDYLQAVHDLTKSLARYYVDRISIDGLSGNERRVFTYKATEYLNEEERLCQELMVYNQSEACQYYAAMLHNRGFMQIKTGYPLDAFVSYIQSLDMRKRLFADYPTVSRADAIAETMVNIGALLLETPGQFVSNNPDIKTDALYYAETALEMYTRHNDGSLYHETNEYKARLLKGTVLYYKGVNVMEKRQGLAILQDVKHWDDNNPDNYYHGTIINEMMKCGLLK